MAIDLTDHSHCAKVLYSYSFIGGKNSLLLLLSLSLHVWRFLTTQTSRNQQSRDVSILGPRHDHDYMGVKTRRRNAVTFLSLFGLFGSGCGVTAPKGEGPPGYRPRQEWHKKCGNNTSESASRKAGLPWWARASIDGLPARRKLWWYRGAWGASITTIGRTAARRDGASDQIQSLYSRGAP